MTYTLYPPTDDLEESARTLESIGLFGATKKKDGTLRLYHRKRKRKDPATGDKVEYEPASLMTLDKRKLLEKWGWRVVSSLADRWHGVFRG